MVGVTIVTSGEQDTSSIVIIVDMTYYHDRDTIASFIDHVQAHPKYNQPIYWASFIMLDD